MTGSSSKGFVIDKDRSSTRSYNVEPSNAKSIQSQSELISELFEVARESAQMERLIQSTYRSRIEAIEQRFVEQRASEQTRYEKQRKQLETEQVERLGKARTKYSRQTAELKEDEEETFGRIEREYNGSMQEAKAAKHRTSSRAKQQYESVRKVPVQFLTKRKGQWTQCAAQVAAERQEFERIMGRRHCEISKIEDPQARQETEGSEDFAQRFTDDLTRTRNTRHSLQNLRSSRFLEDGWPWLLFFLVTPLAAIPFGLWLTWSNLLWIPACIGCGVVLSVGTKLLITPLSKKGTLRIAPRVRGGLRQCEQTISDAIQFAAESANKQKLQNREERDTALREAEERWTNATNVLKQDYERDLPAATARFRDLRNKYEQSWKTTTEQLKEQYPLVIAQCDKKHEDACQELDEAQATEANQTEDIFQKNWAQLEQKWHSGLAKCKQATAQLEEYCQQHFPGWDSIVWPEWTPPRESIDALRFGSYSVTANLPVLDEPGLKVLQPRQGKFAFPALLSFPHRPSLLYEVAGDGREAAVESMQNVMLRLLTSLPAGKVRFTILDPTGLGQNFSAFMHLADFDETLVTSRIWTESDHIDQQLTNLTEHMEDVIQKYLRNEFASIEEYNEFAGEIAEPYHILVVANFPDGFSDEATRRLLSIASSGARCGVYTMISVDSRLQLPRNFDLADLEEHAETLTWSGGRFQWSRQELQRFKLELDTPPDHDAFTEAVRTAGEFAKDANIVEVPFDAVVPPDQDWWTSDSRSGISIPLGRAGATKLQVMELGKGTSQHVLISGKTGSGKSTLLNALITNLALFYSPNEVQYYLIDFKKGVEFKPYATCKLPHARAIAIESEREFGLSVLDRLDREMNARGEMFRQEGVQDVKGYRDANPNAIMPRILLIVDEFQELFVKDDKLAQEAGLLLDRLVRQGRAFGIHVILGSQTLAGAYSLARSTLGQMAVRVALQCSEADAHLILSEGNTAARLLRRPGEAIYNDANGLFEGNHPFQVVWLPDQDREGYLRRVRAMFEERKLTTAPAIVFEGNVPANSSDNGLLANALQSLPDSQLAPRAWLGDAVSIKDPTAATFRRQSGANLLMVSQHDELALGVLTTSLIGLAAESIVDDPQLQPKFILLDSGWKTAEGDSGWQQYFADVQLAAEVIAPRHVSATLTEVAAEVAERLADDDDERPPVFLIVSGLARFRDLQKSDDFSLMGGDDEEKPNKQLAYILREGPSYGVHCLVWCDTFSNVNRWFERATLRDFDMRVLFQMSGMDSSNLIDSAAASLLGVNRAMLFHDETGTFEKFRPYSLPQSEWLREAGELLARRVRSRTT